MAIDLDSVRPPVVRDPQHFDRNSGGRIERLVFNNRPWVLVLCALITIILGYFATKLQVQASFDAMLPQSHPYIRNYLENKGALAGLGNSVRIVVETTQGDIYDRDYLEVVRRINDKVYLTAGVDRAFMRSLWTPIVRWTEVTEEGFRGGPVMPFDYDGTPQAVAKLQENVRKAGLIGNIVGLDQRSSLISVPLLDRLPDSQLPLDYRKLSRVLEDEVRAQVEGATGADGKSRYRIHIIGFAKLVGDLMDGLIQVMMFFGVAAAIATLVIFSFTRDWRSTALLVVTASCGVVWLLGLLQLLGFDLNPYSILVPFLVFAIGLSHGAQKTNGIVQDIGLGTHRYVAARYTFRRLFVAGVTALLTNVVGFAVLMIIDIPVIRELALATSLGVMVLIFTKLFFIPVALSYVGVSESAASRSLRLDTYEERLRASCVLRWLVRCTERRWALVIVGGSVLMGIAAAAISLTSLNIGDLDKGAPELRQNSRYNRDVDYVNKHYGLSGDTFAVIVKTPAGGMRDYLSLIEQDRLAWTLQQLPSVLTTNSVAGGIRLVAPGMFEGNPKWGTVPRNTQTAGNVTQNLLLSNPELMNQDGSVAPVIAYLRDHKAQTLSEIVKVVEDFARAHDTPARQYLLAAGTAGIEAATNIVVEKANYRMLGLLYLAVSILCYYTFRSWRAVVVAMVPLLITSFLCEALMVGLGIGVKVATLPVIALGVGVGVDYALYILSIQLSLQRRGASLAEAYEAALNLTGRVVALVGFTMAAGVITWAWSPIKFQADMGILLAFMFLWNMLGSLVLIPALSHFLLQPSRFSQHAPGASGTFVTQL